MLGYDRDEAEHNEARATLPCDIRHHAGLGMEAWILS